MHPHHFRRVIADGPSTRPQGRRLFIMGVAIGVGLSLGIWPPLPLLYPSITPATASEQPISEIPAPLPWYAVHESPPPRVAPTHRAELPVRCHGHTRAHHCHHA